MPYHPAAEQLRVFLELARNPKHKQLLSGVRLLMVQHVVANTEEMIRHLAGAGVEIFRLISKPYSHDTEVAKKVGERVAGIDVKAFAEAQSTQYIPDLLNEAVEASRGDGRKILLWDIGGYFAAHIEKIPAESQKFFVGVVEDTTFGHNIYQQLVGKMSMPVFSVARSQLKDIEARYVGRDAVDAASIALREIGILASGRNALVLGYGMIGRNVARALQQRDFKVHVYDKKDCLNLQAYTNGFHIHQKSELLKCADIIFSATAETGLTFDDMKNCRDNVVLASVGSNNTEFEIDALSAQASKQEQLSGKVVRYVLPWSKDIMVIKGGTPVNFLLPGLPTEVMDLVFSEMLYCSFRLLSETKDKDRAREGVLNTLPNDVLDKIAHDWLQFANMGAGR
ncbi:MAG: NAD(P)-dependent oxidoreductase [Pirellulaceae bacterium]